jgi:IS5 family transposase
MVRRRKQDRSLFEVLLPDADKLWPTWLKRIDTLLEDEAVIDTVVAALEQRWPQSRRRGRPGTPAEVVLRMLILKHLHDWSFDELEQEVRANLVYRAFTRIGVDAVPDAKTILKIANALGPEVITDLHQRIVDVAKRAGVTRGRRFRIDTTVVETNVHYPTDSTLLQDGVRVLTREMRKAEAAMPPTQPVRDRRRSVGRLGWAIRRQARSPKTRDAMVHSYRRVIAATRATLRDVRTTLRRTGQQLRTATGAAAAALRRARQRLTTIRPLVERAVAQTHARVIGGDTHVPDKVLSLFEPHTEAIRKGKIARPTEFGKMVTIQESEHQIITAFAVHDHRQADTTLWVPALEHHCQIFGRAPDLATGDRGFTSAHNERAAEALGVRRVVLPAQGRRSRPDAPMNVSAGFVAGSGGAPDVKAASAS